MRSRCSRATAAAARAARPPASAAAEQRAARRSSTRRLQLHAAALLHCAGPPSSTARLSRSSTQPSCELSYSTPLPQPFCEPVRLFCGCEPDKLPKDLAEELPEELRMVELEEKAKETEEADVGAAVARACGVINK